MIQKRIKKEKINYVDPLVEHLAGKFGVTKAFVRAAIRSDNDSETATTILNIYTSASERINEIIKSV